MTSEPRTETAVRPARMPTSAAAAVAAMAGVATTLFLDRPRDAGIAPAQLRSPIVAHEVPREDFDRALRTLDRRLGRLAERAEALHGTLSPGAVAATAKAADEPRSASPAPPFALGASETERAALAALSDEELAKRAEYVVRSAPGCLKDFPAARDAWLTYLGRALTPERRADALEKLSGVYRALGESWRSEVAARQAIAIAGPDSLTGRAAQFDLVWALHGQGDVTEAFAAAGALTQSAEPNFRASAQWLIGKIAEEDGDRERAKSAYELCLSLARRRPELAVWSRQVEADVARMR